RCEMSLWNAADNSRTEATCQPQRQPLPGGDEPAVAGVVGAHVADSAAAQVILPFGRRGRRSPLFLEPEGRTALAGTAEIEDFLPPADGPLEKVPIHEHVGTRRVEFSQRTGAGHLSGAPTVYEQRGGRRSRADPDDAELRPVGEVGEHGGE